MLKQYPLPCENDNVTPHSVDVSGSDSIVSSRVKFWVACEHIPWMFVHMTHIYDLHVDCQSTGFCQTRATLNVSFDGRETFDRSLRPFSFWQHPGASEVTRLACATCIERPGYSYIKWKHGLQWELTTQREILAGKTSWAQHTGTGFTGATLASHNCSPCCSRWIIW